MVFNAFRSDSVIDNAISMLEKEYKNGSTENFHRTFYELYESGKLQQYDCDERNYVRVDATTGRATDVFGQGRRTGSTRTVGERTSASNSKNDGRIVRNSGITKKADSNESAFSNGEVKNSIAEIAFSKGSLDESANKRVTDGMYSLHVVVCQDKIEMTKVTKAPDAHKVMKDTSRLVDISIPNIFENVNTPDLLRYIPVRAGIYFQG